jgi:hypothetical protein
MGEHATATITGMSRTRASAETSTPETHALAPSTANRLKMLLPTTFPTEMSTWRRIAATMEVASSGSVQA